MTTSRFDIAGFQAAVEKHWHYHAKCQNLSWAHVERDDGICEIEVAPVLQELYGGVDDGKKVWVGFEFNLTDFLAEPGVEVEDYGACSACVDCNPRPILAIRGTYEGEPFALKVNLEPVPDTDPVERLDTIKQEIRPIKDSNDE
jgi:hypothetical protein